MKIILTEDKKFLRVSECTDAEYDQLKLSLTRKIRGVAWHPLVKKKLWDGKVEFIKGRLIPVGLWDRVTKICEKYNLQLEIEGLEKIINYDFNEEDVTIWAEEFFKDHPKIKPRDYQLKAAALAIKFGLSQSQIATSAGKTLISFLVYGYLKSKGILNRMLVIVPNTTLVMQLKDDWEDYNNGVHKLKIRQVYGGAKDNDLTADVVVGTFQSLSKKEIDFFKGFNVINIDESHQTGVTSIKNVLGKCTDSIIRFGMTGTLKEDESADYFTVEALTGPVINQISPKYLFNEGHATPVKFKIIVLNYEDKEFRESLYNTRRSRQLEGSAILNLEKKYVRNSKRRFKIITDLVAKTTKNTLVLFSDVKDNYGTNMYNTVRETTEKTCFYIDGNTDQDKREYYKKQMEIGENKIMFASFTTFSTGVSIKNLHSIIFTESYKSEIIVKQSIGRGMRQIEGKETFTVVDFVDDLSWNKKDNYLMAHGKDRLEFYKQYTNDISIHSIKV